MLPTPAKCHYMFNLRDISRVISGILMIEPSKVLGVDTMIRLWVHENLRVFHDRLSSASDR